MDTVFSLISESDRNTYIRSLIHSFGCNYICLWLYLPQPTDRLFFLDGYYHEQNNRHGLARRLFDEYRQETFFVVNDRVPGMAFINNQPYRELNELDLQRMASIGVQRQFYQEARIKTAVFMGCRSGEIEMGWSNGTQVNMENAIRGWFSDDIARQQSPIREISQAAVDLNRLSSTSSSSLRSLSMDSPESSSLLFNLPPSTTHIPEVAAFESTSSLQPMPSTLAASAIHQVLQYFQPIETATSPLHHQPLQSLPQLPTTTIPLLHHQQAMQSLKPLTSTTSPHQQSMHAFASTRDIHLPTQESEDAVMTRAILAVLTSTTSSSSSASSLASSSTPNLPRLSQFSQRDSAFKKYLAPITSTTRPNLRRQTMLKRSITYYRSLNIMRREHMQVSRHTSTQLHHMISERKRREKINESFEALRKLLPPEAKKDKASVLTRTREYLTSLKAQIAELNERNKQFEAQLLLAEDASEGSGERVDVRISHVGESTSEEQRIINLLVVLRGECPLSDMVIRILEFLKQVQNVNMISMEATTHLQESRSFNRVTLRLRIEGNEWDESTFLEAVRRVVADML